MTDDDRADVIHRLARDMAEAAIRVAQRQGWESHPERSVFFRSDIGDLETEIANWVEQYMRQDPSP